MNLVNVGKLSVPKKFENAISSIEKIENEYKIVLNEGFIFEFGGTEAVEFSQKAVITTIRTIVEKSDSKDLFTVAENDSVTADIVADDVVHTVENSDENSDSISTKNQNLFGNFPEVQFVQGGVFVENESTTIEVVTSFLTGKKDIPTLAKQFDYATVMFTLEKYNLEKYNFGNFKNMRNGAILGALKFYKRADLVRIFELKFYGISHTERAKKRYGIDAGLHSSHFRLKDDVKKAK